MDGLISTEPGGSNRRSERVDEVCDRFEQAWRAGQSPRIEDYVSAAQKGDRQALLGELVALEWELRRRRGERPAAEEYLDRFPGHGGVVRAAFDTGTTRSLTARANATADGSQIKTNSSSGNALKERPLANYLSRTTRSLENWAVAAWVSSTVLSTVDAVKSWR